MWELRIPVYDKSNRLDIPVVVWETVDTFETQKEALEFAKSEFGAAEDGTIELVYEDENA